MTLKVQRLSPVTGILEVVDVGAPIDFGSPGASLRAVSLPNDGGLAQTFYAKLVPINPAFSGAASNYEMRLTTVSNLIGHGSVGTCPSGQGSGSLTPGLWSNPERNNTGWAMTLIDTAASSSDLYVAWYTFDGQKRPVWLATQPTPLVGQDWWSPLLLYTWNGQSVNHPTMVGEVSIRYLTNDPTRAVVRWKWNEAGITEHTECIRDYFVAGVQRIPEANSAYTGPWFEPSRGGYGIQFTIGQTGASNYAEIATLSVYDSLGRPTWLQDEKLGLTAPPSNGPSTFNLKHRQSPYPGGFPTVLCIENGSPPCIGALTAAGTLTRTYTNANTGTASIAVQAVVPMVPNPNHVINWTRPDNGSGTVNIVRINQSQVIVNRTTCNLSTQAPCTVRVDWAASPNHGTAPRLYRFGPGSAVFRIPVNQPTGEYTDTLTVAGTYRYDLMTEDVPTSNPIARSANVVIIVNGQNPSTCVLSDWTSTFGNPVAGEPDDTVPVRRYTGRCGLQMTTIGQYVQDDRPANESTYQARFYYYTGNRSGGTADIFQARNASGTNIIAVKHDGAQLQFSVNGTATTRSQTVEDNRWYAISLNWSSGTGNGFLAIQIKGAAQGVVNPGTITGIANSADRIETSRLGLIEGAGTGTVGFDEFEARRYSMPERLCRGDADGNGSLTAADVTAIANEIAGTQLATGQPDATEDGVVNSADQAAVSTMVNQSLTCNSN